MSDSLLCSFALLYSDGGVSGEYGIKNVAESTAMNAPAAISPSFAEMALEPSAVALIKDAIAAPRPATVALIKGNIEAFM